MALGLPAALVANQQALAANIRLMCAESTEPLTSQLDDEEIKRGDVDLLTRLCEVGFDVGAGNDEATHEKNLTALNENLGSPATDYEASQRYKEAYMTGYNLGTVQ